MKNKYFLIVISILVVMLSFSCNNESNETPQFQTENAPEELPFDTEEEISPKESNSVGNGMLFLIIISVIILGPGLILFFYYFVPIGLWYEAWLSGVKVSWGTLIVMRWKKVPQELILKTLIKAQNATLTLSAKSLSEHYLAEVDIEKVVNTQIRATNAGLEIELNELAAQFLAKVDVAKVIHAQILAKNADLDIPLKVLSSHYLAEVDIEVVVGALITAHNSGYDEMTLNDLKEHFLSNGDVNKTVEAFVAARKAELPNFTFKDVAAIDLSGIDVVKAIEAAITPRVVETDGVTGIAKDGVQLTMKLKVTLRAHIKTIIGGASEETVLARINESLASEIGMSDSHYQILRSPYELADRVEQKDLGERTAFEIISIDVADIQVGRDINAELAIERAKANAEAAKADVIRAEEKVQKAMAAAFTDGNLSIHDFHTIMNTEADTKMRDSIGKGALNDKDKKKDDEHDKH